MESVVWTGAPGGAERWKTPQRDAKRRKTGNLGTKPEEGKERRSGEGGSAGSSAVFETVTETQNKKVRARPPKERGGVGGGGFE